MNFSKLVGGVLILVCTYSAERESYAATVIESPVQVELDPVTTQKVMKVYGPAHVEYRLQAAPDQTARIEAILQTNPKAVITFDGEVVESGGIKVFRIQGLKADEFTTERPAQMLGAGSSVIETVPREEQVVPENNDLHIK